MVRNGKLVKLKYDESKVFYSIFSYGTWRLNLSLNMETLCLQNEGSCSGTGISNLYEGSQNSELTYTLFAEQLAYKYMN